MLLTVDVGNTNTVLGVFKGDELVRSWRVKTDPRSTADELWLQYRSLVDGYEITGLSVCSTVPATLRELRSMIDDYFSEIRVTIVEPGIKTGVPLLVDNPKEIGADRIVNTLAAHTLFGGPAIVVDFGTSTNLDVVSPKGEFLGGALAPGIEISVDALASRAAQLRKVELVRPKNVIGKNTVEALQSGTIFGFAGQVDGLVDRISAELLESYSAAPTVIATGEMASSRIIFKQLLQAKGFSVMQIDATRVAGVNENLANILMAAKFGVPVCPHAGGVGLCEMVQHLAMWDAVAVSGHHSSRVVEFVDHLHQHFLEPVSVKGGYYIAPQLAGAGAEMHQASIDEYSFPSGSYWKNEANS